MNVCCDDFLPWLCYLLSWIVADGTLSDLDANLELTPTRRGGGKVGAALVALGAMQGPDGEVEVVEEEVAVDIPDGDDGDYDDQGYDDDDGVER